MDFNIQLKRNRLFTQAVMIVCTYTEYTKKLKLFLTILW
jgi:hypothetical protein